MELKFLSISLLLIVIVVSVSSKSLKRKRSSVKANSSLFRRKEESSDNTYPVTETSVSSWGNALQLALYEQEVEDVNAEHRAKQSMERRLIVMPLSDIFQSNKADPMFGKIQYGDKCSLPSSLGKQIFEKRYDVPWLFEMKPVRHLHSEFAPKRLKIEIKSDSGKSEIFDSFLRRNKSRLETVYVSPLDFRSPENYIYLPQWMMRDMAIKPFDIVDLSMVKIKLASLVKLQPLTRDWDQLIEKGQKNPQSLLEHELNKYSSLTTGTTIAISIDGKEYQFYVKETIAEGGVSVNAVRVQDSDIRADIDRSVLDKHLEEDKKAEEEKSLADVERTLNAASTNTKKKSGGTKRKTNIVDSKEEK